MPAAKFIAWERTHTEYFCFIRVAGFASPTAIAYIVIYISFRFNSELKYFVTSAQFVRVL